MKIPMITTITSKLHKSSLLANKTRTAKQIARDKEFALELVKARQERANCINVIPETNIFGLPLYM